MQIRKAIFEDWPHLQRLNQELFNFEASGLSSVWIQDWPMRNEKYYQDVIEHAERSVAFIAQEDEVVVGYVIASFRKAMPSRKEDFFVIIENIFIMSDFRGRGIGRALTGKVKEWALSKGASVLAVSSLADNKKAHSFYRNQGFKDFEIKFEMSLTNEQKMG